MGLVLINNLKNVFITVTYNYIKLQEYYCCRSNTLLLKQKVPTIT